MIKSYAETPRSYIVQTPQGEKGEKGYTSREATIFIKIVPRAPNGENVKFMVTFQKQSSVMQIVSKPVEPQPVVQSVSTPVV